MDKEKTSIQSVGRVFDIVEALSNHVSGLTLTDLAGEVELTPSTAHRFLTSLITKGYAVKDQISGKYRLTLRCYEVGSRVLPGLSILNLARPYMDGLAEQAEEVVHLVARQGYEVLYLYRLNANINTVNMGSYVGLRNPMYCTGVGKSILAYLPEEEVREIWDNTEIIRYTNNTITDYQKLLSELAIARKRGWAEDDEEHELGIRCVAAPIFDMNHRPVAAISIAGTVGRMDQAKTQRLIPLLLTVTESISRLMGSNT